MAALLLPISSRRHGAQRARMLGVGLLYTLATTCYFGALERVSAGATSLLLYLAPAFVILLSWGWVARRAARSWARWRWRAWGWRWWSGCRPPRTGTPWA